MIMGKRRIDEIISGMDIQIKRNYIKYKILYDWMKLKQAGINLESFFTDMGVQSIAIYGMGELGMLFYQEIKNTNVEVKYVLDKNTDIDISEIPVYQPSANLPQVDAIVITPVLITDEIEDLIYDEMGEHTTYVLEEIMYELQRKADAEQVKNR